VVSEHGSPIGMDRRCVGHAFISLTHVFSSLWYMCLLHMHGIG